MLLRSSSVGCIPSLMMLPPLPGTGQGQRSRPEVLGGDDDPGLHGLEVTFGARDDGEGVRVVVRRA